MKSNINKITYASFLILGIFVLGLAIFASPAGAHACSGISCGGSYYGTPTYNYNYYPPVYSYPQYTRPPTYPTPGPIYASCYPSPLSAQTGQNVTWLTSISGGNNSYYVSWTGDDGLSGFGTSLSKVYYNSGYKNASITVTSAGQTISTNCSGSVNVYGSTYYNNPPVVYNPPVYTQPVSYNYYNQYQTPTYVTPTYTSNSYYPTAPTYVASNNSGLQIGCYADPTNASVNQPTTWNVEVTGGALPYTYSWTGSDGLSGNSSSVIKYYGTSGEKSAIVTVTSADGRSGTQACSNSLAIRSNAPTYAYRAPATPVAAAQNQNNGLSAASVFSLSNVPWGWVAVLIIIVLFLTVIYLIFNKQKI